MVLIRGTTKSLRGAKISMENLRGAKKSVENLRGAKNFHHFLENTPTGYPDINQDSQCHTEKLLDGQSLNAHTMIPLVAIPL